MNRRWLWAAIAVAVVAAGTVALVLASRPPGRGKPTIDDPAFVRAANRLCGEEVPDLRAPRRREGEAGTDEQVATRIEQVADRLDQLAIRLAAIPVRSVGDQGEVAGWLEEWANFTGIGREYAEAIRQDEPTRRIEEQSNDSVRAIARFARANRIDACVL